VANGLSMTERWSEILLTPTREGIMVAAACRCYGLLRQTLQLCSASTR
jgi:hypothetical protein